MQEEIWQAETISCQHSSTTVLPVLLSWAHSMNCPCDWMPEMVGVDLMEMTPLTEMVFLNLEPLMMRKRKTRLLKVLWVSWVYSVGCRPRKYKTQNIIFLNCVHAIIMIFALHISLTFQNSTFLIAIIII